MMIGYMVFQLAIIGCKWASPISSRTLFPRMGKYSADEPNKQKTKLTEASHKPYSMGSVFFMSIVIGLLAGLVSWLFRLLIGFIHNLTFTNQLSPYYDANMHTPGSPLGWLVIFVPVLGGLIVVFLIRNYAPKAKGHEVPEVMNAIYHKRGRIPGHDLGTLNEAQY